MTKSVEMSNVQPATSTPITAPVSTEAKLEDKLETKVVDPKVSSAIAEDLVLFKLTLGKILKELKAIREDVDILLALESERITPTWKNKLIDFLIAVFHTQPHEEEEESRRKTL